MQWWIGSYDETPNEADAGTPSVKVVDTGVARAVVRLHRIKEIEVIN